MYKNDLVSINYLSSLCIYSSHVVIDTVEPGLKIVNDVKKPRHGDPEVNDKTGTTGLL